MGFRASINADAHTKAEDQIVAQTTSALSELIETFPVTEQASLFETMHSVAATLLFSAPLNEGRFTRDTSPSPWKPPGESTNERTYDVTMTSDLALTGQKSQRVRGCEPEGVRKHLLSKKVFLCSKKVCRKKKGFLRNLRKPSQNPFSF